MSRPIAAYISVAAMAANLQQVRARAASSRIWAVIKANAYGHGLASACEGFADADGLALIEFDHAARLRALGWNGPLLMLEGAFDAEDVRSAAHLNAALVVHSHHQVRWITAYRGPPLDLWIKVDTGMNRLGFATNELAAVYATLKPLSTVSRLSMMTHFADAEREGGTDRPLERFDQAAAGLQGWQSLANSGAVLCAPQTHRDWVRPGIMLYGATPMEHHSAADLGLRATMSLRSELIAVRQVQAGDGVGYGSTFVADRSMRLGIVACGYADGYPRRAPTGTPIEVDGVRTRTVGRVSMDMITVDLEPVPQAQVGASVELWGDRVPIDLVAAHAGTIGYELMCGLAPRVPVHIVRG
ncbi:MAG: alanine racemase [Burkholderiales bacterium]|nr:alanine racemase [Burkholderiales bacterium]